MNLRSEAWTTSSSTASSVSITTTQTCTTTWCIYNLQLLVLVRPSDASVLLQCLRLVTEAEGAQMMRSRWGWLEAALRCRCCCWCWWWCWCGKATLHRRRQKRMSGGRFPSSRQPNPLIQTQPLLLPPPAAAATPAAGAATRGALSSQGVSFVWAKVGDELMMPLRAARKIQSWRERAESYPFLVWVLVLQCHQESSLML